METKAEYILWRQVGRLKQDIQFEKNKMNWQRFHGVIWILISALVWCFVFQCWAGGVLMLPSMMFGEMIILEKRYLLDD